MSYCRAKGSPLCAREEPWYVLYLFDCGISAIADILHCPEVMTVDNTEAPVR